MDENDENDENYSDVDWSDGAGSDNEVDDATKSDSNDGTLTLNIGAPTRDDEDAKKRKRDTVVYTDEDRANALECHQNDLRTAYYRSLLVSKWCNNEFLSATLVSLLPSTLSHVLQEKKNAKVDDALKVANWFRKFFTKLKDTFLTADEGRDGCCAEELISGIIPNAAGSAHQLNQLFVCLLRAIGFDARYVRAIDPRSYKPNGHEEIVAAAKLRASKKPKTLPGQNGKKGKWARNVLELASEHPKDDGKESEKLSNKEEQSRNKVIELLSDDEDEINNSIDENKIISVKMKKEDIPKCWVEVYLYMPKVQKSEKSEKSSPSTTHKNIKNMEKEAADNKESDENNKKNKRGNKNDDRRSTNRKKDEKGGNHECISPTMQTSDNSATSTIKNKDVEVIDESDVSTGRYVHIDLFNGGPKVGAVIDKPKTVESCIRGRRPVSYCVAVDSSGLMVDVTNRYSNALGVTKKLRLPNIEWWEELINESVNSSTIYRSKRDRKSLISPSFIPSSNPPYSVINIDCDDTLEESSTFHATTSGIDSSSSSSRIGSSSSSSGIGSSSSCSGIGSSSSCSSQIASSAASNSLEMSHANNAPIEIDEIDEDIDREENNNKKRRQYENEKEIEITREKRRAKQRLQAEQEEFLSLALSEPIPSTLSGFKNHPLFILERDIKGDRGIDPSNEKAKAGLFKEETVYYLSAVEDLKTRHQWRMIMKDVMMRDISKADLDKRNGDNGVRNGDNGAPSLFGLDPTADERTDFEKERAKNKEDEREKRDGKGEEEGTKINSLDSVSDLKDTNNGNSSSSGSSSSNNSNSNNNPTDAYPTTIDDAIDEDFIIIEYIQKDQTDGPLSEPIPPHRVVMRKRGDQEARVELYGAWQTVPYEVESVKNGIIPTNKHGNVEVWDFNENLVPKGARLLQSRHAIKAAGSLGLPCAPAIVGFENKGQYTAPKIGGAVVLAEHYFLLLEAVGNIQEDKEEKAEAAWESKMVTRWADLVRKVITRQRLKVQYGH